MMDNGARVTISGNDLRKARLLDRACDDRVGLMERASAATA
jgi:hypothetical protein